MGLFTMSEEEARDIINKPHVRQEIQPMQTNIEMGDEVIVESANGQRFAAEVIASADNGSCLTVQILAPMEDDDEIPRGEG